MRAHKKFRGRHKFICDIDGMQYYSEDKRITWDGLVVYKRNFYTRHPQDLITSIPEDTSVDNPRPDSVPTFTTVPNLQPDIDPALTTAIIHRIVQVMRQGRDVNVQLPTPSGGNPPYYYAFSPPLNGTLALDSNFVLTGRPALRPQGGHIYQGTATLHDSDDDLSPEDSRSFLLLLFSLN